MIIDQISIMQEEIEEVSEWAKKNRKKIIKIIKLPDKKAVVFIRS